MKGENVPNFKFNTSTGTTTGTSSNVFHVLQDLRLKQYQPGKVLSRSNVNLTSQIPTLFKTYSTTDNFF